MRTAKEAAEKPILLDVWEYGHLAFNGYRVRREIVVEFRQNVAGDFVVVQNADEPDKQLAKQTEQQIKRSEWAAFVAMKTFRRNYACGGTNLDGAVEAMEEAEGMGA